MLRNENKKKLSVNFITTNAHSLAPKIDSLLDAFSKLDQHFAVITESWFKDNKNLREAVLDLNGGANIDMIMYNRMTRTGKRTAGGGTAIAFDEMDIRAGHNDIQQTLSNIVKCKRLVPLSS